ncbi:DNA methyltransferase [Brasilonema sp. UFV-L1]|uniref:Eco57I restriction-modification methylase domain-containing protein n=1 Tax=Brasilonema sp. UFV-L1 TaxID=2234130 RepID=UPI00145E1812|nr:DNA methyltransferase [Brasilonema sp. UFV-L1]NMG09440.1 ATP-binding protein [Brasilonema sp. UFV-L1]
MVLNFQKTRNLLYNFQFEDLFIEELGWSQPTRRKAVPLEIENKIYEYKCIAESSGVAIFEVTAADGAIPEAKIRAAIHQEITKFKAENLLIFIDSQRTRSLWYWVKREGKKSYTRDHLYVKGQPGDLFLSKLGSLVIDITELEDNRLSVVEIAHRLQKAFDVERVTKQFYKEFQEQHKQFLGYVQGINNTHDRRWYTSVLLNRMMFVYFLQRKRFIDNGDLNYLQNQLKQSKQRGENQFYNTFLKALFFESFAKPETDRDASVQALVGNVKYLNGGLFLKHRIEQEYNIAIADEAFEQVLDLFARYSWNLDDTPEGKDDEINPHVLGYIFEKYINQKAFRAYYTRPQITEYLCDRTIHKLIVDRVNDAISDNYKPFEDINELFLKLDANVCRLLIKDILPNLSILDPACGSGAFLVAAMKTLIQVYSAVIGTIDLMEDVNLKRELEDTRKLHKSLSYYIKKRIVTDNLYGVDIMEEATEIAKLRLFLALVSSAHDVEELEPLPNIDFNIMAGNSLIGLIRVDDTAFDTVGNTKQGNLLQLLTAANYKTILNEKNKSIELYKKHAFIPGEEKLSAGEPGTSQQSRLQMLRTHIEKLNRESQEKLNLLLLDEFSQRLGIKYEEVQLTGKSNKRVLTPKDIAALKPFHWGYHFDKVLENGGFDAIITNPPWEIFKPQAKEFFAKYNELVTKNKMDIKTFEKEQNKLLQNPEIAEAWLEYQSQYPHVSAYYRSSEEYKNQISIVNAKKAGTDINLYKLFVERCFHLLRDGGECGIVVPSGIYTDLGTKQLREMLFSQTKVTGLFCLENRKEIFEGVDCRFKFVVLTFAKGGKTTEFPSAFMRLDVQELEIFPSHESLRISVEIVRKLSPDSLSVMEFKNEIDVRIAEKMLKFPLLGEKIEGKWNLVLCNEFHMTNDSHLFYKDFQTGRLPLYEGKMIHQFTHQWSKSQYWINELEARQALLGKQQETRQRLNYQKYRLAFREIARNTDARTIIANLLPVNVFANHKLFLSHLDKSTITYPELLYVCGLLNSFAFDFIARQRVTTSISMFIFYQLPIPRLTEGDRHFTDIIQRAAKLICTTKEFDELAQEVGLGSHKNGVTNESDRAKLRAELDGMIAHLYGLTEEEFAYILSTFPIVPDIVKEAALEAYRTFAPQPIAA